MNRHLDGIAAATLTAVGVAKDECELAAEARGAARALRGIAGVIRKGLQVSEVLMGRPITEVVSQVVDNDLMLIEGYAGSFEKNGAPVFAEIEEASNESVTESTRRLLTAIINARASRTARAALDDDNEGPFF